MSEDRVMKPGSVLGKIARTVAVVAVLGLGAWGANYVLSIERKVPEAGGHGAEEKDDGHGHGGGGEHGDHAHGEGEAHGRAIKLSEKQRANAKLGIVAAGPGTIRQLLPLNGIIQPNEEATVAVLPRFGGIVKSLNKRLGEQVKKGEVVARIESNESLTQYELTAPIDGLVIERNGVLGEFADNSKRLLVIADLKDVWVDLRVYSQDFNKLKVGQKVEIDLPGHAEPHGAAISYLSPIGLTDTQSMLARAVVENHDGGFLPGLFVTGRVLIAERPVQVAVKQTALQYVDGRPVVFVEDEDGFEKRDVEIGLKDDAIAEIVSGVLPGEKVVVDNSFILKAELGKGEAEHVH